MPELQEVKTLLEGIQTDLSQKVEERDEQIRKTGEASSENAKAIKELSEQYHQTYQELKETVESAQSDVDEALAKFKAAKPMTETERKTLGKAFVESDAYKSYIEAEAHGHSQKFDVGASLGAMDTKAITGASLGNTATYLYEVDRFAEYVKDPDRSQFVRSLLPTFGVSTGSVEFVRETAFTNNAGMVPEYQPIDSGEKPASDISFEVVTTPLRTMAHYIPVTRQIVDDERQLQGYIENRLLYGLRLKEDQQLLYGTGAGNELQGILTDVSIQSYPQDPNETLIDAIRRAMTKAFVSEYRPTGVVIHHNDWEDIELEKGSDDHYIWVNVTTANGRRLWGLPVIPTNAINESQVLVGDFTRGSAVHDRENANIRISDSHSDFFTKNLWALLAEERIAQSVLRPDAFVDVTVYTGP